METFNKGIMGRIVLSVLACILAVGMFTLSGCGNGGGSDAGSDTPITVVSREDGSGTRGAFIELMGVEEKDASGEKVDMTTEDAIINNSTSVVLTTVAGDENAIGYISLGSLNDTVKAVAIDGATPSVDTVKSGEYKVARPFNIATLGQVDATTQDFIDYILSSDGQKIVEDNGYISAVDNAPAYTASNASGKITVAGSSSVSPVMEKLAEGYMALNPDVNIEINTSDSTTGMESAASGVCNIGMASRELKDTELDAGLTPTVIAQDGIAIIVNNANSVSELTSDQVKGIYTGEITTWEEL
jgi:phosphate transport system substrate-binding protein